MLQRIIMITMLVKGQCLGGSRARWLSRSSAGWGFDWWLSGSDECSLKGVGVVPDQLEQLDRRDCHVSTDYVCSSITTYE